MPPSEFATLPFAICPTAQFPVPIHRQLNHTGRFCGFTLIELPVLVIAIAILLSLIVPSFSSSRSAAHTASDAANLRAQLSLHLVYTTDNRGDFFNPFRAVDSENAGKWPLPLDGPGDPNARTCAAFLFAHDNRFAGEAFLAYWYSYMMAREGRADLRMDAGFALADADSIALYRDRAATLSEALFPGSFYYSPTFFKDPAAYAFTAAPPSESPNPLGPRPRHARRTRWPLPDVLRRDALRPARARCRAVRLAPPLPSPHAPRPRTHSHRPPHDRRSRR